MSAAQERTAVTISTELWHRLEAFQPLAEALIERPVDADSVFDLVVNRGLTAFLLDIIGHSDQETLLLTVLRIGNENPAYLYDFVTRRLKEGAEVARSEAARRHMGFSHTP